MKYLSFSQSESRTQNINDLGAMAVSSVLKVSDLTFSSLCGCTTTSFDILFVLNIARRRSQVR